MLVEQLRRSWYDSSPAYARVAITLLQLATAQYYNTKHDYQIVVGRSIHLINSN
jgi:hypothetical protein